MAKDSKTINTTLVAFEYISKHGSDLAYIACYQQFAMFVEGHYVLQEPSDVMRGIWRFVTTESAGKQISDAQVKDIYKQMEYACDISFAESSTSHIAFTDCLLNTDTFRTIKHDKKIPVIFNLPFEYEDVRNGDEKPFTDFLETVLVKEKDKDLPDHELIGLMQELFGYSLLSHVKAETAFFFVGAGANGKGVTTSLLAEMIGADYVLYMSIESLTTRMFSTPALIGKRLNISNEEESKYIKSDKLKSLISGEPTSAERKYGAPFQFQPNAKFIFCSNNLPVFDDLNYGLRRRFKIIPFHRSFDAVERDKNLRSKLIEYLPGIVKWSIAGAKKLIHNGYVFSSPEAAEEAARDFENASSSTLRYLRETFTPGTKDDGRFICYPDLYQSYRSWCDTIGKHPVHLPNFQKDMHRIEAYSEEAERGTCPNHKKQERGWYFKEKVDELPKPDTKPPETKKPEPEYPIPF